MITNHHLHCFPFQSFKNLTIFCQSHPPWHHSQLHQSLNFGLRQGACLIQKKYQYLIIVCMHTHWIFSFNLSQACLLWSCFWKQAFSFFWPVYVVGNPSTSSQKLNFMSLIGHAECLRHPHPISM